MATPRVPSFNFTNTGRSGGYKPPKQSIAFGTTGLKGLKPSAAPRFSSTISVKSAPSVASGITSSSSSLLKPYSFSLSGAGANPFDMGSGAGSLSAQQLLALQQAAQSHNSGGLVDQIESGAGSVLGKVLNVISRPSWAMAHATDNALNGGSILGGLASGLEGNPLTFGQVLAKHHVLDGHSILRGALGLGLDIGTDPTNLALIAATPITGGTSDAALVARLAAEGGIEKIASEEGTKGVASILSGLARERSPQVMEHFQGLIEDPSSLAKMHPGLSTDELKGIAQGYHDQASAILGAARDDLPKVLQLQLAVPKVARIGLTPTKIGGMRVAPYAPSLLRTADKLGIVGKIPLVNHAAEALGRTFKPGWRDPIAHAMEMATIHTGEYKSNKYIADALGKMVNGGYHLSDDAMRQALHAYQQPGVVDAATHAISEEALHAADPTLSAEQTKFVHDWHSTMVEQLRLDKAHGIEHGSEPFKDGRGYVPMNFNRSGIQRAASMKGAIRAGFTKKRVSELTIQDLHDLHGQGALTYEPQTDPMKLLLHRLTAGGMQHARMQMEHVATEMFGVPARISDEAANAARGARAEAAHQAVAAQAGHLRFNLPRIQREARAARELHNRETLDKLASRYDERANRERESLKKLRRRKGGLVTAANKAKDKHASEVAPHDDAALDVKAHETKVRAQEKRVHNMESQAEELDKKIADAVANERHLGNSKNAESEAFKSERQALRGHLKTQRDQLKQLKSDLKDAEAAHTAMLSQAQALVEHQAEHVNGSFKDTKQALIEETQKHLESVRETNVQAAARVAPKVHPAERELQRITEDLAHQKSEMENIQEEIRMADNSEDKAYYREELQMHKEAMRETQAEFRKASQKVERLRKGTDSPQVKKLRGEIDKVVNLRKRVQQALDQTKDAAKIAQYRGIIREALDKENDLLGEIHKIGGSSLTPGEVEHTPSELEHAVEEKLAGIKSARGAKALGELVGHDHPALVALREARDQVVPPAASHVDAVNKLGEHINSLHDKIGTQQAIVDEASNDVAEHVASTRTPNKVGRPNVPESVRLSRAREKFAEKLNTERSVLDEHYEELAAAHAHAHALGPRPARPHPEAEYLNRVEAGINRRIARIEHQKQQALVKHAFHQDSKLDDLEAKLYRDRQRAQARLLRLQSHATEASRIAEGDKTMANPLLHRGLQKVPTISSKHYYPKEIAEGLQRAKEFTTHPDDVRKIVRAIDKTMSKWKILVTAVNPGYRVRNTLTDMWNAYIAGMPMRDMPKYWGAALKLMHDAKNGVPEAERTMAQAQSHGVLTGLFQGDVKKGMVEFTGKKGGPLARYERQMLRFNTSAENAGRMAHYLWRLDHGHDVTAAAREVRRAHFDYEDLTETEKKLFKRVAPFYTWTRKNVPYQIVQTMSRPGRVSTFSKAAQESEFASGDTKGELLPDFLRNAGAFKVPFFGKHTYYIPQVGIMDLARISDPSQYGSFLGPQYAIPAAALFGVNSFSGQPVQGSHKLNPGSALLADTLGHVPGLDRLVGQTQRDIGGKEVKGPGISPWLDFALGQIPALQFLNKSVKNPIAAKENPTGFRAASYLTGTPLFDVNQDEQKQIALLQFQQQMQQYLRNLRDAGKFPNATVRKKSKNEQMLENILYTAQGRR